MLSSAATWTEGGQRKIMVNDVRRANCNVLVTRELVIALVEEDPDHGSGFIRKFSLCFYRTSDVALHWQNTPSRHLEHPGLNRGLGHFEVS